MESNFYFEKEIKDKNIILTPKEGYNKVIIFLHGLKQSAEEFLDIFFNKNLPIPLKMKVLLLNSPQFYVEGEFVNSWYEIKSFDKSKNTFSIKDVLKSSKLVEDVIHKEAVNNEILGDYSKIFLSGFSQGCFMSLFIGLQLEKNLGGIIGFSGALFSSVILKEEKKKLPILLIHGKLDDFIKYEYGIKSYKRLKEFNIKIHSFNSGHLIEETGLNEMKKFLINISPKF
jgi:phospholipase/carboxylesterase